MKFKFIASILFVGFLVIAVVAASFLWWSNATAAPSINAQSKRILITKGMTAEAIADLLAKEGVIKNSLAFKIYTQVTDLSQKMQAGEFSVPANLKLEDVVKRLLSGPTEIWVTIPEGLRREQIAEKFADTLELAPDQATVFRQEFLTLSQNLEGYLFPETYLFPKTASPSAVIKRLSTTFEQKTAELNLTRDDVILASILERETRKADEAPIVAGILTNRLKIGMALQADATAQYAIGSLKCEALSNECEWWTTPTLEDLKIDSRFNTYKYPGLPPAPIASPGLAMLKAAADPAVTAYFYYIHTPDGQIYYAETLSEHNSNVQKYLR